MRRFHFHTLFDLRLALEVVELSSLVRDAKASRHLFDIQSPPRSRKRSRSLLTKPETDSDSDGHPQSDTEFVKQVRVCVFLWQTQVSKKAHQYLDPVHGAALINRATDFVVLRVRSCH